MRTTGPSDAYSYRARHSFIAYRLHVPIHHTRAVRERCRAPIICFSPNIAGGFGLARSGQYRQFF